jgi:hypothetical protein
MKLGITFHAPSSLGECERMNGSEFPLGELKSWWTSEFSEVDCMGQNPLDWGVFYIMRKLLDHRCLKWAHMTHLGSWNIIYGQKKGWESNWQFDSRPLKVKNRPNFLVCRWRATYDWKALNKGYNFASNFISIIGLHTKLWVSKMARVPILGISRLPLESPRRKWHLGVGLVAINR